MLRILQLLLQINGFTVTFKNNNGEQNIINAKHVITTVGGLHFGKILPFIEGAVICQKSIH